MRKLTFEETPKTRKDFIAKWNTDHVFRARAEYTGFTVLCGACVQLPNGMIAGAKVK